MSIALRLNQFLEGRKIKVYLLEKELDLGARSLHKAIQENRSIGSETIGKIVTKFPDLDIYWLLTGIKKPASAEPVDYVKVVEEREKERDRLHATIDALLENSEVQDAKIYSLTQHLAKLAAELDPKKTVEGQLAALGSLESSYYEQNSGTYTPFSQTANRSESEDKGRKPVIMQYVKG